MHGAIVAVNNVISFWNIVPNSELTKIAVVWCTWVWIHTGQRSIVAVVTLSVVHICLQYCVNTMTAAQHVAQVRLQQLRPVCLTDFLVKLSLLSVRPWSRVQRQ